MIKNSKKHLFCSKTPKSVQNRKKHLKVPKKGGVLFKEGFDQVNTCYGCANNKDKPPSTPSSSSVNSNLKGISTLLSA